MVFYVTGYVTGGVESVGVLSVGVVVDVAVVMLLFGLYVVLALWGLVVGVLLYLL